MGLLVTQISLVDFRSYERFELEPDPRITILVGPNAAGKTNVVEGVQILTTGVSFRRPQWGDTVRWGSETAVLEMDAVGDGRRLEVKATIQRPGRREFVVNGKIKRRVADAVRNIPCVTFTPDDLRLVKDAAHRRRTAIDELGVQLSESYGRLKAEYEQTVRQRNSALKERLPQAQIDVLTDVLVDKGVRLVGHRRGLVEKIAAATCVVHRHIAPGAELGVTYTPSWQRDGADSGADDEDAFRSHLKVVEADERRRGVTLSGPHRDEIAFILDERNARTFASQGQQRTIALALKLGEVAVVTEVTGQKPILLLDDVMSELDETRRAALATYVGTAAQTFVTTTTTDYFEMETVSQAKVVALKS